MDINALNKANIGNLASLWKIMGLQQPSPFTAEELHISKSWPNRYWFDWGVDLTKIPTLSESLVQLPLDGIIPVWRMEIESPGFLESLLIDNGFRVAFEQTAMYLDLASHSVGKCRVTNIARVCSTQEIEDWTKIASESFGYEIDVSVIHTIADNPDVQLLLALSDGQVAATAMLYKTAEVIGMHQVGVAKQHQGKGIASSLVQHIIGACNVWAGRYIVLQASVEAKSLYTRLGFKQQFMIRNYQRVF